MQIWCSGKNVLLLSMLKTVELISILTGFFANIQIYSTDKMQCKENSISCI